MGNEVSGPISKIKLLRLLSGLSQTEVARALRISQTRMSELERGKKPLSPKEERGLARKIGFPRDAKKI